MLNPLPYQRTRLVFAIALCLSTASCRDSALAFGPDAASARTAFDDVAGALEARFTNVSRAPQFARARLRLARYAFAPSKLVDDSAIWTSPAARTTRVRDLELHAGLVGNQYLFTARAAVPSPTRLGDQRHLIQLRQTAEDEWFWHTEVDHAIGSMPPARVTAATRILLATGERDRRTVQADYRAAFPRTAQALGRLVTMDSLLTLPQSDGSTLVTLRYRFDGERLKATMPAFGAYIRKYVEPARYHLRLADASSDWFDVEGSDGRLTIRFRSRGGQLQPLGGASRAMPDSLTIHVDALAHLGLFTVGVTRLQGAFVFVRTARERSWLMRFNKEPEWHLPLIAERLLRTPLRHPFAGRGVLVQLGIRAGERDQTLIVRTVDVAVRESAIMRFLGTLGFTAMNDFAGRVEEEENRFIADAMRAMRADIAALK